MDLRSKGSFIWKSLYYYVILDIRNIFRVIVIKIDNFYLKDFATKEGEKRHPRDKEDQL